LKMSRSRSDVRPYIPHQDHAALKHLLVIEFAASVNPPADGGRKRKAALFGISPVNTPLMRFGTVETNCQAVDVGIRRRTIDLEFIHRRAPSPDTPCNLSALELNPSIRARQWM